MQLEDWTALTPALSPKERENRRRFPSHQTRI